MPETQIYVPTAKYDQTIDELEAQALALADADTDKMALGMVRTSIIEALGEMGVWPTECLAY